MNLFIIILFWAGIISVIDGSLGILFQEKWQKWVGELNIQRLAWIEISMGWVLLAAHYLMASRM